MVAGYRMTLKAQIRSRKQAVATLGNIPTREAMIPVWRRAREHTEEALGTLVKLMRDPDEAGSLRAFCADRILDRGWGKAPIMVAGDSERPITVDVRNFGAERIAELESALLAALGESIQAQALPHLGPGAAPAKDPPLKTRPPDGLPVAGSILSPDPRLPASDADKGSTKRELEIGPDSFPLRSDLSTEPG